MSDVNKCTHNWTVSSECSRCLRDQLDKVTAQRDEARELVRSSLDAIMTSQQTARFKTAAARWDEEGR